MRLAWDGAGLRRLLFPTEEPVPDDWRPGTRPPADADAQLAEYFDGQRHSFDLPLAADGTQFQQRVWTQLSLIPFGQTRSYGDIATALGQPGASRAVGMANNANPLPIVVPCHRVIGADGSLVGFGGGLPIKRWLLDHEQPTLTLSL